MNQNHRHSTAVLRAKSWRATVMARCMAEVRRIAGMSLPEARLHVDAVLAMAGPVITDSSNDAAIQSYIALGMQKAAQG